jgi:hypothetical protein
MADTALTRRTLLAGVACLAFAGAARAGDSLTFDELYGKVSVLGLAFSDKVKALAGKTVAMRGFMAPPLKAEAKFFVLTEIPMSLCPFCSSDADWPSNIVVVYIDEKSTFVPPSKLIEVTGTLEVGSWTDPETGFVSLLRLVHSSFETV